MNKPNVQRIDMTGQQCSLLTVLSYSHYDKRSGQAHWRCICDCGREAVVSGKNLRRGMTRSCGCLVRKQNMRGTADDE